MPTSKPPYEKSALGALFKCGIRNAECGIKDEEAPEPSPLGRVAAKPTGEVAIR